MHLVPDPNRGTNRDCQNALKDSSLFSFWLCMLISWNLPFGPQRDDMRFSEMREGLRNCLEGNPRENVFFRVNVRQPYILLQKDGTPVCSWDPD